MDTDTKVPFDHDAGEKQCRACLVLHSQNQVYSLCSKNLTVIEDGSEQTIAEIYHQCTQLPYEPDDERAKWMCQYCTEKLIEFFQFRKMCIDSYNSLSLTVVSSLGNEQVKLEILNVSADAASDGIELADSVVIKEENDFDCDSIHMNDTIESSSHDDASKSKNSRVNCLASDNGQNMTLRKRCSINKEDEPNLRQKITEENKDNNHVNDDNDSEFNGFNDYDDDSSDDSSISDQAVMILLLYIFRLN